MLLKLKKKPWAKCYQSCFGEDVDEIRWVDELGSYIKMDKHGAMGQTYV